MRIRTPFTQLFSYHFVSPLIDIVSHAFPSDLMMANKQGKIQMYFYELLWLIQRLDNKKNIRLDRWPRSGRPFPAVEDERRRVDTLSECLSSPL
jgi:hypothetical protein